MATTKRNTKGRATASRAKTTARSRVVKKATTAKKPVVTAKAKTKAPVKAKPTRATAPKQAAKKPGAEHPEVAALKAKASRERTGLERRLTDAVREIGILRHHELRAIQFERQLAERDATIGRLQTQLTELERRPVEPTYVREIQQTLALGEPVQESAADTTDLDEFEDDRLGDDADLATDEE